MPGTDEAIALQKPYLLSIMGEVSNRKDEILRLGGGGMQGIIIAGGFGTRFRPLTYTRPKPLMPILNRPLLEYQVGLLKAHGITEIVFATNYMAEAMERHFGDGIRFGVKMRYAQEDQPLGTAGAIRNAANSLWRRETVVVFNGDIVTDFDLSAIIELHRKRGARATIALKAVPSPNPYGVLDLDSEGRVLAWREPTEEQKKALAANPNVEQTGWDYINAGFYVLEPEVIESIPEGRMVSIEREIYPRMIAQRRGFIRRACRGLLGGRRGSCTILEGHQRPVAGTSEPSSTRRTAGGGFVVYGARAGTLYARRRCDGTYRGRSYRGRGGTFARYGGHRRGLPHRTRMRAGGLRAAGESTSRRGNRPHSRDWRLRGIYRGG